MDCFHAICVECMQQLCDVGCECKCMCGSVCVIACCHAPRSRFVLNQKLFGAGFMMDEDRRIQTTERANKRGNERDRRSDNKKS